MAVYPTLMGELDDPQSNFGGGNSGQDSNNPFGDHNQLGTIHDYNDAQEGNGKIIQGADRADGGITGY